MLASVQAAPVRLKDVGKFAGWRTNALVGYGLVTGLAGTGDNPGSHATRQALANLLTQFNLSVTGEQVLSRNVAAVMVTAALPPYATVGDTLDVTVTSIGDARSLAGGSLLLAPLRAANQRVYALAQGPLSVGGYHYDLNGNATQKNHPTVGAIPGGATVEVGIEAHLLNGQQRLTFTLAQPDATSAARAAAAINTAFGSGMARARDAEAIEISVPEEQRSRLVDFMAGLEAVVFEPDSQARVVINERTGTVVAGAGVRIDKVVVSHGDLKISIVTDYAVSQPPWGRQAGAGVRTAEVANTRIDVQEKGETGLVGVNSNTVADLVGALTRLKIATRDIISVLRAIKAAGALHADLVIQ
ncbi:flagellar basal body P-ring protein FlgI [Massilia endophytica]|uniref:flagellar basal body P-ring protein FlgI n=1 Tax=Massilia endophytica TaxID=2899220 RepID=UPI001E2B7A6C|nr:flagellar basal body P-ring protein FlgI [Massilia endophytica]UGQ47963.1 flagellar basal body P-ring protein FlgI [Massilia endophytica]